jgi:glyoxylase-like metal-dependent hydrolase (beta-lactamase superfamily II)
MQHAPTPPPFKIGNIEVQQVVEMQLPLFEPDTFLPTSTAEEVAAIAPDFTPWALCDVTGKLILALQTYVLRTRHHTILVDTCVGCDKASGIPVWHMRTDTGWLQRLAAIGVAPESVDYVFCTHLHGDHIGWNTRLVDGRFVPVFTNAKYIFAKREVEFVQSSTLENRLLAYQQSVLPVLEANQAQLVETDFALDDEVWLTPTPGHTPGHVAVNIKSAGVEAVMVGDAIHSPLQCVHPEWSALPDSNPALAAQTRISLLDSCMADDRLVLTAHFPLPSVGRVSPAERGFGFTFGHGS